MSKEIKKGAAKAAPNSEVNAPDPVGLATQSSDLVSLQAENEVLKAEVNPEVEALKAKNEALEAELADAAEVIADLKDQLKSGGNAKGPIGKVGNEKYRIVGGFRTKDKVFTAQDIAADSKLVAKLVDQQSSLVEKI